MVNQHINVENLDRETRDRLDLKSMTDPTFYRALEEDYTENLFEILNSRKDVDSNHSFIASVEGGQGCYLLGTKITTIHGIKNIEDIKSGELVWSGGSWRRCSLVKRGIQKTISIKLGNNQIINLTGDHVVKTSLGWKRAKDLVVGDIFILGDIPWCSRWNNDSLKGALVAMLMADGHLDIIRAKEKYDYIRKTNRKQKRIAKKEYINLRKRVRFYKSDISLRKFFQDGLISLGLMSNYKCEYNDINTKSTKVVCILNKKIFDFFERAGVPIGKKSNIIKIPDWIQKNDAAMNGFLAGYFACDGSFYKNRIEISSCSYELIKQMMVWLQSRGISCRIHISVSKIASYNTIYRLIIPNQDDLIVWQNNVPNISSIKRVAVVKKKSKKTTSKKYMSSVISVSEGVSGYVFDLQVDDVHEYLADGFFTHNSGKSYLGIALCFMLDPNFSLDNIYFDYNDLVYNKSNLKPGTAVLVDEQSESYGVDSHRVNIILEALKEQLRKKSIHFIFCSPTLKPEYACLEANTIVNIKGKGYIPIGNVCVGDYIISDDGKYIKVLNKVNTIKECKEIRPRHGKKIILSEEHRLMTDFGLKCTGDLKVGDNLKMGALDLGVGDKKDYFIGYFHGAYLADGTININHGKQRSCSGRMVDNVSRFLRISNMDTGLQKYLVYLSRYFKFSSCKVFRRGVTFYGKDQVLELYNLFGKNLTEKRMPEITSRNYALGILNGFVNHDSSWALSRGGPSSKKNRFDVKLNISSSSLAVGMCDILHYFGIYPSIREYKSSGHLDQYILYVPRVQVKKFFSLIRLKNNWKKKLFSQIMKMDKYKEKIANRDVPYNKYYKKNNFYDKFAPNDSTDIIMSIDNVGPKKCVDIEVESDNHLFQIGGGIISHNSSMYVMETMFLDYETEECYAAFKTRDLHTLGYVRVPHPVNAGVSEDFLAAYEAKKDRHLDKLTGRTQQDDIEIWCDKVMSSDLFKIAEKIYLKKCGYIPSSMLHQIINKLYTELRSSIIVNEIAARIKLNRELEGKWDVPGAGRKKKEKKLVYK